MPEDLDRSAMKNCRLSRFLLILEALSYSRLGMTARQVSEKLDGDTSRIRATYRDLKTLHTWGYLTREHKRKRSSDCSRSAFHYKLDASKINFVISMFPSTEEN